MESQESPEILPGPETMRIGLALSGGVLRGAAHVGVLQVLEREGIVPDIVVGTSIGAIVGAAYVAGVPLDDISELFRTLSWPRLARLAWRRGLGLLDTTPLQRFVQQTIGVDTFDELSRPFAVVTTDIVTGERVVLTEGSVAEAAYASAALPGLFPPIEKEGRFLIDGGVVDNMPVDVARAMGADYIIGVDLLPVHSRDKPPTHWLEVLLAANELWLRGNHPNPDTVDCYIAPDVAGFLGFDFREVPELEERGRAAAEQRIPQLKADLHRQLGSSTFMKYKSLHEDNRRSWNHGTAAHNSHKQDQAAFFRAGGSTLFQDEIDLLGSIAGRTLVHLQCNAGQDSLSLAARGAIVTGVDISDTAIEFARQLSDDAGIAATFDRADLYDWFAETEADRFDIAFSSYGAIVWLSDLSAWARGIARVLKPGGRFILIEFHPIASTYDWSWKRDQSYFSEGEPLTFEHGIGDYVALAGAALAPSGFVEGVQDFVNPEPGHEFQWPVSEVIQALLDAGLALRAFREYPYTNGARLWDDMRELPGGRMVPPDHIPTLPLMYSIVAEKSV